MTEKKKIESKNELVHYGQLLDTVKQRIRQGQVRAALSANTELTAMYWDIGKMIHLRQKKEGWGTAVIPRLSRDIRNELSDIKGFSERNIGRMIAFYKEYPDCVILPQPVAKMQTKYQSAKLPQSVAKIQALADKPITIVPLAVAQLQISDNKSITILQQLVAKIPWGHNILLIEKVKNLDTRLWYVRAILEHGWGRDTLAAMIKNNVYERQSSAITNFEERLPASQSELAQQLLKDPYVFDFMTLEEPFHERELELGLIQHLEKFLLELGQGFSFVGRQYHLEVSNKDFYIDLLFYHLKLRCFVVIDLKKGEFKPEYAGKMNFYCSVVDDQLKHKSDQPTIGLILCQTKDKILAEYALRDINKPIGVSDYELTRALPKELKSSLPSIEEIEAELKNDIEPGGAK